MDTCSLPPIERKVPTDAGKTATPSPRPSPRKQKESKASSARAAPTKAPSPSTLKRRSEASEDVMKRMQQMCATTQGNLETKSLPKKSNVFLWLTVAVVLVAVVLVVSTYALLQKMLSRQSAQPMLCTNEDCVSHGSTLKAALSDAVEPCADFYEYVCKGWQPVNEAATTVQEDMLWSAVLRYTKQWKKETSLPARLHMTCMNTSKPLESERGKFLDFMRALRISWPDKPEKGASPFDVLVGLSVNWNMGLWLGVHVIQPVGSHRMIYLDKGTIGDTWYEKQSSLSKEGVYNNYVVEFLTLLGKPVEISLNITQLQNDEDTVLRMLLSETELDQREATYPISSMESVTRSIPVQLWLTTLNTHYHPTFKFTKNDIVYVQSVAWLKAVDEILRTMPSDRLMNVIGWTFVQKYALLALLGFHEAGALRFGSAEDYANTKLLFCFENTQNSYGLLAVVDFLNKKFGRHERQKIDELIQSLKGSAQHLMAHSAWIDEETKSAARKKVLNVVTDLWPGDDVLVSPQALEDYYKDFPPINASFFDSYLELVKKVRALRGHKRFHEIYQRHSIFTALSMFHYSYVMNTAFVTLQALQNPLYHRNGTPAMNYGGFGLFYASEMVKSFDEEGVRFVGTTENNAQLSWWTNASSAAYNSRLNCNVKNSSQSRVFPFLPALAVSFRAYTEEVNSGRQADLQLAPLPEFSGRQIFFMTYCFSLCSKSHNERHDCNFPLMNSEDFAEAFKCPSNSFMNPPQKCNFFV
ncbi:endothelin-converting enzyme 1-like isoform X2 [Ornithodoros turicata]|uniref:endothelin-converting enzyme 1-like isoform X2 n=1 Tax=Ornithodoros turicata TaxID=34597 RepID=UPI00313A06E1